MTTHYKSYRFLTLAALTSLSLCACSTFGKTAQDNAQEEPDTIIAENLNAPISLNDEAAVQSALAAGENAPKSVTTFSADGTTTIENAETSTPKAIQASQTERASPVVSKVQTMENALGTGCPNVQILSDAQSITYFDETTTASPNRANIIARASLKEVRGGCEITAKGLEVDLDMLMSGMIGPKGRFEGRNDIEAFMTFPYFIAVFDETGRPYSKQILATAMRFDAMQDRTEHAEKITQAIPVATKDNMSDFTITIGFQLNRSQLAYNKAQGLDGIRDTKPATPDVTTDKSVNVDAPKGKMKPIFN